MCGITGYFNKKASRPAHLVIHEMTNRIKHRGPDDEGYVLFKDSYANCYIGDDSPEEVKSGNLPYTSSTPIEEASSADFSMGHRRLSILDLSAKGHQPLCSSKQNFWLVFNGEIYNYIELREELIGLGHSFESSTDSEVLLNGYIQWGPTVLEKLNGMFSFVIYDTENEKLFGARDSLGVKPFYFYHKDECFAFASEQQALNVIPEFNNHLNKQYLFDYFVFGDHERRRESIFSCISELKGGEYFTYDLIDNKLDIHSFLNLESKIDTLSTPELQELIIESIRLRLRSDVEVGTCLSGGVDSSSIVGVMRHILGDSKPIHSFTSHYPGFSFDEKQYADEVIQKNKLNGHFTSPSAEEFKNDYSEFIQSLDLPIWSTSTYAQWRVLKLAKQEGIKVVLDGQGADELFTGYNPHYMAYWRDLIKGFKIGLLLSETKSTYGITKSASYFIKEWMRHYGVRKLPKGMAIYAHHKAYEDLKFLDIDFYRSEVNEAYDHFRSRLDQNQLTGFLKSELVNGKLKTYLRCEDRCSMWHSVESRTPFADDLQLIRSALVLTNQQRIKDGMKKFTLRESMKDFLPSKIYDRKDKIGFVTPNNDWIRAISSSLQPQFNDQMKGIFNLEHLQTNYTDFFHPKGNVENGRVFKYLAFSQWHKKFVHH